MKRFCALLLAAHAAFWPTAVLGAAAPACLSGFISDIRKTIGDAAEADELFSRILAFSDDGARGATVAVQAVGGDRFVTLFENLDDLSSAGRSPFASDDEVFEVIARLSDSSTRGTTAAVGHLASAQANDAQGALFSLFVTKKTAGDGTNYGAIVALEENFSGIGGATRRVDLIEVGGIHHECKSWTEVVTGPADGRLRRYADVEFPSDIVLHVGNDFTTYRVDFPALINTPEQLATVKTELLAQFDTDQVRAALGGADAAADAKRAFSDAWDRGDIAKFHVFS